MRCFAPRGLVIGLEGELHEVRIHRFGATRGDASASFRHFQHGHPAAALAVGRPLTFAEASVRWTLRNAQGAVVGK